MSLVTVPRLRPLSGRLAAFAMLAVLNVALADTTPKEVARFKRVYEAAGEAYRAAPQDTRKAWEFARACFDRAEVISAEKVKESIALEGIAACRAAIKAAPADAPSHYYLGLNLGQLARTKSIGALKIVRQMEAAWQTARTLDETFGFGGPDRSLGILYAECPRPPLSIGSRDKARRHLEKCVSLAPDHPENRLHFAEQLLNWGEKAKALEQLEAVDALWPAARQRLSGDEWQGEWTGWERRARVLRGKLKPDESGKTASK